MPNDCCNTVNITFKNQKDCDNFIKKYIRDNKFDFNRVVPEPKTKEECKESYILSNRISIMLDSERPWFDWYRFHINEWGTKWNSYENNISRNKNKLTMYFSTAWTPSIPVIENLIIQNPTAKINYTYYECGMQLAGGVKGNISYQILPYDERKYREWLIKQGYEEDDTI